MAYFQQQILSGVPGGANPILERETITSADVGADDYAGVSTRDLDDVDFADLPGSPPIRTKLHFNSTSHIFRYRNTTSWVDITPTDVNVFDTTKVSTDPGIPPRTVVWLGKNNGATGSAQVTSYSSLLTYFNSNNYSSSNVYYFYNSESDEVEEVIKYVAPGQIQIVKGNLAESYINKAVTFDEDFTITNPKVRLAHDDSIVVGSILGYTYNKLQIAVDGWDIKFINGTTAPLVVGRKIIGKNVNNNPGYIQEAPDYALISGNELLRSNARGHITYSDSSKASVAGQSIVKVSLIFGGW